MYKFTHLRQIHNETTRRNIVSAISPPETQRKSRFICRVGVIINRFCRLVGRQSELQKKPHTALSLVNFTVTYPSCRGPSIFQDTSFRLTSKDRRASQGSGYLHVMHVINTICARSCEWAATCHWIFSALFELNMQEKIQPHIFYFDSLEHCCWLVMITLIQV